MRAVDESLASTLLGEVHERRDRFLSLCRTLVEIETPSDRPETFAPLMDVLEAELKSLGYQPRRIPGKTTAGVLYGRPSGRTGAGSQLILAHADTVHPPGTLEGSPWRVDEAGERAEGPGLFDMKAGVAQLLVALDVLHDRGFTPPLLPLVFVNTDEEIGSPESSRHIPRLARLARRALVLEPALGPDGLLKTARKGIGHYTVTIRGVASHAGIAPEKGSSAILELTHVIQKLNDLNDPDEGITVNVGVIEGGTRSNVVASSSRAEVDVRVYTADQAQAMDRAIRALKPENPSVTLSVEGGFRRPPMERTDRNRRLWETVRDSGAKLGLELGETRSGGASDGNIASQHTATVDGLGPVGDGAHESHEHIEIEPTLGRTALLALVLLQPPDSSPGGNPRE